MDKKVTAGIVIMLAFIFLLSFFISFHYLQNDAISALNISKSENNVLGSNERVTL